MGFRSGGERRGKKRVKNLSVEKGKEKGRGCQGETGRGKI